MIAHPRYRLEGAYPIAPKITTPTKNAAASARFPRRVEVTFLTVITIQARRSAMKLSV